MFNKTPHKVFRALFFFLAYSKTKASGWQRKKNKYKQTLSTRGCVFSIAYTEHERAPCTDTTHYMNFRPRELHLLNPQKSEFLHPSQKIIDHHDNGVCWYIISGTQTEHGKESCCFRVCFTQHGNFETKRNATHPRKVSYLERSRVSLTYKLREKTGTTYFWVYLAQ